LKTCYRSQKDKRKKVKPQVMSTEFCTATTPSLEEEEFENMLPITEG